MWLYVSGMGTKIVERITTNSFGLESVDCSGFVRFGVDDQRKSSKENWPTTKKRTEFLFKGQWIGFLKSKVLSPSDGQCKPKKIFSSNRYVILTHAYIAYILIWLFNPVSCSILVLIFHFFSSVTKLKSKSVYTDQFGVIQTRFLFIKDLRYMFCFEYILPFQFKSVAFWISEKIIFSINELRHALLFAYLPTLWLY